MVVSALILVKLLLRVALHYFAESWNFSDRAKPITRA